MARRRNKKTHCLNCEFSFKEEDNYCPKCGQVNHDLKIPLKHLIHEFFESIFHLDGKIWITLKYFFLYPGRLTDEYLKGHRTKFIPPIRLFIFFGFIYFLFLSKSDPYVSDGKYDFENRYFHLNFKGDADSSDILNSNLRDSFNDHTQDSKDKKVSFLKAIEQRIILNLEIASKEEIYKIYLKSYSYSFYFLLPILALFLKLFYNRRFYYEHMITSLHLHCLMYLLLSIFLILNSLIKSYNLDIAIILGNLVFLILSSKLIYANNWISTIVKSCMIFILYLCSITLFAFISIVYSIYIYT